MVGCEDGCCVRISGRANQKISIGTLDTVRAANVEELGGEFVMLSIKYQDGERAKLVSDFGESIRRANSGKYLLPDRVDEHRHVAFYQLV